MELGIYAANMPEALGGGGLDNVSLVLLERELGRAAYALQYLYIFNVILSSECQYYEQIEYHTMY